MSRPPIICEDPAPFRFKQAGLLQRHRYSVQGFLCLSDCFSFMESVMRKCTAGVLVLILLAGCGGPPPPTPQPEPEAAFVLEGAIHDEDENSVPGITIRVLPIGSGNPIGLTRSDSTGTYRIEMAQSPPTPRILVLVNSNRHVHHDARFMPTMERISLAEDGNHQRRFYYLTPSSEVPPPQDVDLYVLKPLCNVRAAPNAESPVVAQVKKGQAVKYLERDGEWYWVQLKDGSRGWIYRMLVTTPDHRMPE